MNEIQFRIQEPDAAPREVKVKAGMKIGRDPENDLCIADQNVSGFHAQILDSGEGLAIEDLGSSNKTVIVGGPVLSQGEKHPLDNGTVFKMGRTKIAVFVDETKKPSREVARTQAERILPEAAQNEPPKTVVSEAKRPASPAPKADAKSADKANAKDAGKSDAKPAGKSDAKDAGKTDAKPTEKPAAKAEAKANKPAAKSDAKPAAKADAKPAVNPEAKAPKAPSEDSVEKPSKAAPAEAAIEPKKPAADAKSDAKDAAKAKPAAKSSPDAPAKAKAAKPKAAEKKPAEPVDLKSPREFTFSRYHIDVGTYFTKHQKLECEDFEDVLGGLGRAFKVLEEFDVEDPHDPKAPLIMNLGILSGSQFMTGLRTYFHGYSPLKASLEDKPSAMWSAGSGKFGTKLRYLGVDEVVFTGRAVMPVYLHITQDEKTEKPKFQFKPAQHLQGLTINQKIQHLYKQYPDAHFAAIGPAGENFEGVRFAAIGLSTQNQLKTGDMKSRFCGRGGMGGLMGSKNIMAIVADVKETKKSTKVDGLKEINMEVARGEGSRRFRDAKKGDGGGGTWANMTALNPLHAMPENNFNPTGTDISVPLYRANVEAAGELMVKDEACFQCGIACHKNIYDAVEKDGKVKPGKFHAKLDYEPLNLMSSNLGIFDIHHAVHLVDMVDDFGMDSISCGVTLSYAMEYNRRKKEAGEPSAIPDYIEYGNYEGTMKAVKEIANGRLPLLGQGSKRLSEALGETEYAMHCKGVEFPAYLPQFNPGYPWALAGGHMSMKTYLLYVFEKEKGVDYWVDAITDRGCLIMRDDIIGICKFAALSNEKMAEALRLITGLDISEAQLEDTVKRGFLRGLKLEKKQGFTNDDYRMPLEVHKEYEKIDLEHFNTVEFFEEVRTKVCKIFDDMLLTSGI